MTALTPSTKLEPSWSDPLNLSKRWTPHKYQKKAVKFMIDRPHSGLFLDPGLGKTAITLAAIKLLKKKGYLKKVLVIAPLRPCYLVWPAEVVLWQDFHGLTYTVLHGPKKHDRVHDDADIYIINFDGLEWFLPKRQVRKPNGRIDHVVDIRAFKKMGFDTVVFDELSKFKHISTRRFKMMKDLLYTFKRRWGLTGSPAANGLLDLFGQCFMLDEGKTLGRYKTHYRHNYFTPVDFQQRTWVIRHGAEKEIYKKLSKLVLRMDANDYLELPKAVDVNVEVDMPEKAWSTYMEMEQLLITEVEKETFTAQSAPAAAMKCRQITSGALYKDPVLGEVKKAKRPWKKIHDAKIEALVDLIDELNGQPLLVAYEFQHDLERIRQALGKDVPCLGESNNIEKLKELEKEWNQGEIQVLLGHPQSIGHGLNLQFSGGQICWFSPTWDFELYDQFNRRIRRQGNKSKRVFIYHLIVNHTIDKTMMYAVRRKDRCQTALFEALKELGVKKG